MKYKIEFNILASVSKINSHSPLEVYSTLRSLGTQFIQFTPLIERISDKPSEKYNLKLGHPDAPDRSEAEKTPWSVQRGHYGKFMKTVFKHWIKNDVGRVFVMN